uniref:Transposase-associated domain-containing protein n=1 Tax=Ananas comosus var. bracteatus TaxID=296719 RepID=A0A6V7NHI2_ANACO|nr:unnamed protein product [Ananas comosus var. bracteatus]
MGIDKSWMSLRNRACNEYEKGIDIFLDFAFKRLGNVKRIRCPCAKCFNVRFKSRTEVKYDLFRNGIIQSYTKWHHHGELSDESSESDAEDVNIPIDQGSRNMETMLDDLFGHVSNSSNTNTSDGECNSKIEQLAISDWNRATMCVLKNCEEVSPYVREHIEEVQSKYDSDVELRHEEQFLGWFQAKIAKMFDNRDKTVSQELLHLARGPDKRVNKYTGYLINGFRFHTKEHEKFLKTQNSGVFVRGDDGLSSKEYYGLILDIIELQYQGSKRIALFKCHWWDVYNCGRGYKEDENGFFLVNVDRELATNTTDPYILASQAQQVYYAKDIRDPKWLVVVKTQPRDLYDVPTIETSANDQEESTSTPIQENENIGDFYRIDGDKDHGDLCNVELARANVEEIVFDAMVGESKKSIVQVNKSNRASTSSRRTMECRSEKPWLRSQSQNSEPTPPLSEDPHASTHLPSTITDRPSSPNTANPDTNTTAKKKGRGPTTNPNAKKRKEENKGKVEFSKRLGRAVGGLQLAEFITEMGVVLRQYAPLNVNKWAEVPMHYKDKMWDDLMRDPETEVDPDLTEYWKATHQRRTDNSWCSENAQNAMQQFEHVRKSQEELGDPPLSTEEHLTKAFGARSGYLRGLGCGPKPLSSKNLEAKASKEAIERQIEELKNELKQSREENEEREARLQRERDEREERFKKEIEEIKVQFKAEFNEQLKLFVQLYGAPTTSSPPSTQNH